MSLYEQIKHEQIEARKAKATVKASLLTTLLGEIQTAVIGSKTATAGDSEVIKVVKKFVKNTNETIRLRDNETSREELAILEAYLPKPLTDGQLAAVVSAEVMLGKSEGKKGGALVGYVMAQLKIGYADRYDAAKVKGLVESHE